LIILFLPLNELFGQDVPGIPASLLIADGTPVKLQLNQTISSAHARIGDRLDFVVPADVTIKGLTVIPTGSIASATVIGVKHRRLLGIGGKVVLKLDSVRLADGDRVPLRARTEVKGSSHTKLMAAAILGVSTFFWPATPAFLLWRGGDSTVLKGTEVTGHVDGDAWVQAANLAKAKDNLSGMNDPMTFVPPRVLNGEGREGDMVNLLFVAQASDLQGAFQHGGWIKVDQWKPVMAWHLLWQRTRDAKLPMARFYLFGRIQDYSYALPDPTAIVTRRHHLRIWRTDHEMDGYPVWAAAATHDIAIELGKHGHLISHRIDPNVDAERDFVGENLAKTRFVRSQEYVHGVDPVFKAQTAAGEAYYSDSRILLLDMHRVMTSQDDRTGEASTVPGSITSTMSSANAGIPPLLKSSVPTSAALAFGQAH
jgi:hypothetical protein